MSKELLVDEFITHTMPLASINDAADLMKKGEWYNQFKFDPRFNLIINLISFLAFDVF